MKSNKLFKDILRLVAVIAFSSFLSACAGNASFSTSESSGSIQGYQSVRKPAVGQQWVYNVRDLYNNLVIDTITETVASVTPVIEIKRESQKNGQLTSEIQSSAGLVVRDPYWNPPVNFVGPMPMWPQSSDKSQTFVTSYKTGEDRSGSANLNTPISEFSAILMGPMGQKVERVNGKTTKTYPLTQVKSQSGASSHCWG